jgi:hypothetical protein
VLLEAQKEQKTLAELSSQFGIYAILKIKAHKNETEDYIVSGASWETLIRMDSPGRASENRLTDRFWHSVKWEEVYVKGYATVLEARTRIGNNMKFYNSERKHQSLYDKTPAEIYFGKEENLT